MKALIRNEEEPITAEMGIPCIDWDTEAPLTNAKWFGGPYILVTDYVPDAAQATPAQAPAADVSPCGCTNPSAASQPADAPAQDPPADTIVIDGVTYTRAA